MGLLAPSASVSMVHGQSLQSCIFTKIRKPRSRNRCLCSLVVLSSYLGFPTLYQFRDPQNLMVISKKIVVRKTSKRERERETKRPVPATSCQAGIASRTTSWGGFFFSFLFFLIYFSPTLIAVMCKNALQRPREPPKIERYFGALDLRECSYHQNGPKNFSLRRSSVTNFWDFVRMVRWAGFLGFQRKHTLGSIITPI